jgi:hypothetical protein
MKYLKVLTSFAKSIEILSDAEKGRLFTAMLEYAETGKEPTLNGSERFVWPAAKLNIDKYDARCKTNQKNASMRWDANQCEPMRTDANVCELMQTDANACEPMQKEKGEEKERTKEKEDSKRNNNIIYKFIPPSVEDVREYCLQKGYRLDAERFVDFYTSKGWMIGKNKMKDWKAAVRTWVREATQGKGGAAETANPFLRGLMKGVDDEEE